MVSLDYYNPGNAQHGQHFKKDFHPSVVFACPATNVLSILIKFSARLDITYMLVCILWQSAFSEHLMASYPLDVDDIYIDGLPRYG
jgi:hypothetical protein